MWVSYFVSRHWQSLETKSELNEGQSHIVTQRCVDVLWSMDDTSPSNSVWMVPGTQDDGYDD